MLTLPETLNWIDEQQEAMSQTLIRWGNINSGTANIMGLQNMGDELMQYMKILPGEVERFNLGEYTVINRQGQEEPRPLGDILRLRKQVPDTQRLRVIFAIHYDTVYAQDSPFQKVQLKDGNLHGPGVADAKGGLLVLLNTVRALERSEIGSFVSYEVILNPDEEISSPGSRRIFESAAGDFDIGMVYEPSLPDGGLISERKGSGNFDIIVKGKAAHAGRDFASGRNAIIGASQLALQLHELNDSLEGVTINVARIDGGGAINVVPDTSVIRCNARMPDRNMMDRTTEAITTMVRDANGKDDLKITLHGGITAPPKPMTDSMQIMLNLARDCGARMGMPIDWKPSGGVCDGSRLAAGGLPTLDTLGVRGDGIHSHNEYMIIESLSERVKLSFMIIADLVTGACKIPPHGARA